MSKNPLLRYLTKRELELAAEYEALGDEPERRDAIRKELYNLRWRLNEDSARKYHTTGKGRRNATVRATAAGERRLAEGTSAGNADASRDHAKRKRQGALYPRTRSRARHHLHRREEEVLRRPQETSELFFRRDGYCRPKNLPLLLGAAMATR